MNNNHYIHVYVYNFALILILHLFAPQWTIYVWDLKKGGGLFLKTDIWEENI